MKHNIKYIPPNLFLFIIRARQINSVYTCVHSHTHSHIHTTPTHVASGKVILRVISSSHGSSCI